MTQHAAATPAASSTAPSTRLRPNALAPAFGLAGLAGTWTVAEAELGAPHVVQTALWALAALVWAIAIARWTVAARRAGAVRSDLTDPITGPFAALAPAVAVLAGARTAVAAPRVGTVLVVAAVAAATVYAATFLGSLVTRQRDLAAVHGGYLLPTVAAGLLSAQALAQVGLHHAAAAAFAVGILFWLLIGALLVIRLVLAPHLPDALVPTLAIVSAPPAVAGNAWFVLTDAAHDPVQDGLLGTFVVFAAFQIALAPRYRRLRFASGFWALTFTIAASATYVVRWLALTQPTGWQAWAWAAVLTATTAIGTIAARSTAAALSRLLRHPSTPGPHPAAGTPHRRNA